MHGLKYILPPEQQRKIAADITLTQSHKRTLAMLLHTQVKQRFITLGTSGGTRWPDKFSTRMGVHTAKTQPLTGATGNLLKSFHAQPTFNGAEIESALPYAATHQTGATIRPVKAKALFIPISDVAQTSQRLTGNIKFFQRGRRGATIEKVVAGFTYAKPRTNQAGETQAYQQLKKGRLKDGRLQVWDARRAEYKDGTPDFIFLKKVTILPRPMLPDSPGEQDAQVEALDEIFGITR